MMTMNCSDINQHLRDFAKGSCAPDVAFAIQEHLTGCRLCAWQLDRVRGVVSLVAWPRELASKLSEAAWLHADTVLPAAGDLQPDRGRPMRAAALLTVMLIWGAWSLSKPSRHQIARAPVQATLGVPAPAVPSPAVLARAIVPKQSPRPSAKPVLSERDQVAAVIGGHYGLLDGDAAREASRRLMAATEVDLLVPDTATLLRSLEPMLQKRGRLRIQRVLLLPVCVEIQLGGEFPPDQLVAEVRELRAFLKKAGTPRNPLAEAEPFLLAGKRLVRVRVGLLSKVSATE
jgi:hypothetical protein